MTSDLIAGLPDPDLPFKFVGGDPALDLVNTVDWTARGPYEDRLSDYGRLLEWSQGADVLAARLASKFRRLAESDQRAARAAHRQAVELRWVLRRVFACVADGQPLASEPALPELNDRLAAALGRLRIASVTRDPSSEADPEMVARWGWSDAADRLDSVLWPVIRSAADLLVSDEATRIRQCGGVDCGWLYVDRSRNGLRRWCQMESCGTREKSRQRAMRRRQEA